MPCEATWHKAQLLGDTQSLPAHSVLCVAAAAPVQFPEVFWDNSIDYFGITQPPGEDSRGRCFMFWNLARFNNSAPLLAALVSGRSARAAEGGDAQELQQHMLEVWHSHVC